MNLKGVTLFKSLLVLAALTWSAPTVYAQLVFQNGFEGLFSTQPRYFEGALRNPLKGFTTFGVDTGDDAHPWTTLAHVYLRWNELENSETDGLDKILSVSDDRFDGAPESNIKVIPRVYLHWNGDEKHWPADMQDDDYTSEQFQTRALRLVERLGIAWNNDPRVAFVEMGIFGKWGEHHSPDPTQDMQNLIGNAFNQAFPNKQVSVRHVWDQFRSGSFGEYWDSWGHQQQMWPHGGGIASKNQSDDLYLTHYVGGEVAYNWGDWQTQPGESPTDSLTDPVHRDFLVNSVRWLHGTQLRWISNYDQNSAAARRGAEILQRAMGYRFVLDRVSFSARVDNGQLQVELAVINEGSAPFYYAWPVEIALHDPDTREVVWRDSFTAADIRDWTPGRDWTEPQWESIDGWPGQVVRAGWSDQSLEWATPAPTHQLAEQFFVDVPLGLYILSVAVLDPAGMHPTLKFATRQYWSGARHPVGIVGVGVPGGGALPSDWTFDNPAQDDTLYYSSDSP